MNYDELELRWFQDECAKEMLQAIIDDPTCHPVAAMPTASGKSLAICEFINKYLSHFPFANVLILSHVKEILKQDYTDLCGYFAGFKIGLYSAGLGSRTIEKITVAGIQSIYMKTDEFAHFDLVIIDECHLIRARQGGMYRDFLEVLSATYCGFTATHFRLDHGYIHKGDNALFTKIAYDLSQPKMFNRLVEEGYLAKLITKGTNLRIDTDKIKIRGGDFASDSMSETIDLKAVTDAACKEIIEFGKNYKLWLIFCIDIQHAEHVAEELRLHSITTACIHSKMTESRDTVIQDAREGKYQAIVNVDILTTGFNLKSVDLIAMLRPTMSPVIHVQTIGRGLRVIEGKEHCLVLDFAGNISRLGPINNPLVKKKRKGNGEGNAVMKECPKCFCHAFPSQKFCEVCGHQFEFKHKLEKTASTGEVVAKVGFHWETVLQVRYYLNRPIDKPASMRVNYLLNGGAVVQEWICLDHEEGSRANQMARHWVSKRLDGECPKSVRKLLERSSELKHPTRILVNQSSKFARIKDAILVDPIVEDKISF